MPYTPQRESKSAIYAFCLFSFSQENKMINKQDKKEGKCSDDSFENRHDKNETQTKKSFVVAHKSLNSCSSESPYF